MPGGRSDDFRVAELQLRLLQHGLRGLFVGLLRLHVGLPDGQLRGRVALVLRQARFHLRQLGLPLFHACGRPASTVARLASTAGVLSFGGGRHLVELLLRNLFVLDEQGVAREIGLGLGGVGLRFGQARDGGFAIAFGNSDGGLRVSDVGFGAGDVGAVFRPAVIGTLGRCAVTWLRACATWARA